MKHPALMAFLGGIALGATVALLFAPHKGEVTRRKIKRLAKDEQQKVMDFIGSIKDEYIDRT